MKTSNTPAFIEKMQYGKKKKKPVTANMKKTKPKKGK